MALALQLGGMLDIYPYIIETIAEVRPLARRVARCDADLGRQLQRALSSIALNTAEGAYSRGRNSNARFHTAMGSARESVAFLEVAQALGLLGAIPDSVEERFNRIIGTLHRLSV